MAQSRSTSFHVQKPRCSSAGAFTATSIWTPLHRLGALGAQLGFGLGSCSELLFSGPPLGRYAVSSNGCRCYLCQQHMTNPTHHFRKSRRRAAGWAVTLLRGLLPFEALMPVSGRGRGRPVSSQLPAFSHAPWHRWPGEVTMSWTPHRAEPAGNMSQIIIALWPAAMGRTTRAELRDETWEFT